MGGAGSKAKSIQVPRLSEQRRALIFMLRSSLEIDSPQPSHQSLPRLSAKVPPPLLPGHSLLACSTHEQRRRRRTEEQLVHSIRVRPHAGCKQSSLRGFVGTHTLYLVVTSARLRRFGPATLCIAWLAGHLLRSDRSSRRSLCNLCVMGDAAGPISVHLDPSLLFLLPPSAMLTEGVRLITLGAGDFPSPVSSCGRWRHTECSLPTRHLLSVLGTLATSRFREHCSVRSHLSGTVQTILLATTSSCASRCRMLKLKQLERCGLVRYLSLHTT